MSLLKKPQFVHILNLSIDVADLQSYIYERDLNLCHNVKTHLFFSLFNNSSIASSNSPKFGSTL
jgi:hypothetical protein